MTLKENHEEVVSQFSHRCVSKGFKFACVEVGRKLTLKHLIAGNPMENEIEVNYCPFCGYLIP